VVLAGGKQGDPVQVDFDNPILAIWGGGLVSNYLYNYNYHVSYTKIATVGTQTFFSVRKSKICKFLASFRYKSTNFLPVAARKS
jgi:hypothetical protein